MKYFTLLIIFSLFVTNHALAITNGMLASDVIGQYDGTSYTDPVGIFTKGGVNDGPNIFGISAPEQTIIDSSNHRFFVSEYSNNRVLVYNLNEDNTFPDKFPDYVLGQPDFYSNTANLTQAGMNQPLGLAYDSVNKRLFVSEWLNKRILIFDVAEITNGEPAINVLGQADFTSSIVETTQSSTNRPRYLAYDSIYQRLFVAQPSTHRVTVFDVNEITNGEPAINVLGQVDFTSSVIASTTQTGMREPSGVAYDSINNRLFVGQNIGRRVTVYDVTEITNGEPAINVLGQTSFTANSSATSQIGGGVVYGVEYDSINNRLFVGGSTANRLLVYNVDPTVLIPNNSATDGPNAINVLGQTDFVTITANTTQSGFFYPLSSTYDNINNKLYISDYSNSRIMIFDTTTIDNGENAVDLIGQYDQTSYTNPVPIYTKGGVNDGPNVFGFNLPYGIEIDTIHHRLFVSDGSNNRVLIYNLADDNILEDKFPDYVLGQPDLYTNTALTTQSGLSNPTGLVYDSQNSRLFVADYGNKRVVIFDLSDGITNGENAINVLGQSDFVTSTVRTTQNGLGTMLRQIDYDPINKRLFVCDNGNHRIIVYNADPLILIANDIATNGPNAINVLGQADFTSKVTATTSTGMNNPRGLVYDSQNGRLFVGDSTNNRILIFDVTEIINGEPAINVLGQPDFITSTINSTTQNGMNGNYGLEYDSINNRLFSSGAQPRVLVFDVNEIVDGENAIAILGQPDFTTSISNITQNGINSTIRESKYDEVNDFV